MRKLKSCKLTTFMNQGIARRRLRACEIAGYPFSARSLRAVFLLSAAQGSAQDIVKLFPVHGPCDLHIAIG